MRGQPVVETRRRRQTPAWIWVIAALAVLPAPMRAQSGATGAMAGTVKDASGAVLPGVTVEAASPALIEKVRTVVTDNQGEYKIIDLRPGTYSVTFTLTGFSAVRREGLELNTGVTLPVNADLRVGTLEETVTVTGASPVVDVQNVRSQTVLTRAVLDTLPTGKGIQAFASLTLGARSNAAQDVGGNKGEATAGITVHNSRIGDALALLDGMNFSINGGQTGTLAKINQVSVQEITLVTGGNSAESETGGAVMNVVPKEGGNGFRGVFQGSGSGPGLQGSNLSDELRARGLTSGQTIKRLYDVGGGLGGPIKRDKLWFWTGHRWWGSQEYAPGNYFNKTQGTLIYTPDLSRPAYTNTYQEAHDLRVTWQASTKHKFAFTEVVQHDCLCFKRLDIENVSPEATANTLYWPLNIVQGAWTYTASNRLLLEAGISNFVGHFTSPHTEGVTNTDIPVTEQSTGYRYNALAGITGAQTYGDFPWEQANGRFAVSYVTGSHAFKSGLMWGWWHSEEHTQANDPPLNYLFRKPTPDALPVPQAVTQLASPSAFVSRSQQYAFYAQDQWTHRNLTLNLGLRYDSLRGYIPEQTRPGGIFTPPIPIAYIDNVPNWKDITPRLGAAYDLFGNGKTAIKWSLGRYAIADYVGTTNAVNPATSVVNSATRSWNDSFYPAGDPRRGNYAPDCELTSTAANGECGALSSNGFGTVQVQRTYAADVLRGWNVRPYNWQTNVVLQHELRPGMGMMVGYYRTWYGNFRATQNQAVTPADFDPFCITGPVDSRVPGLTGAQVCGFYDIRPEKFGLTQNLVTQASNFGTVTDTHDAIDLAVNARFGKGLFNGGVSVGRTVIDSCAIANTHPEVTAAMGLPTALATSGAAFNTSTSPAQFCHVVAPWWSVGGQVKFGVAYSLPWDLETSATFQNLPGTDMNSNYVATNAEIARSLGRNIGACRGQSVCTASVTLTNSLIPLYTAFEDRLNQLDLRLAKVVRVGRMRLKGMVDVYNVFNANTIGTETITYNPSNTYLRPTSILGARLFKFGVDMDF